MTNRKNVNWNTLLDSNNILSFYISESFRNLSKQRKNKLHHPRKHNLPPEIFLISASVLPALPVA